MANDREISDPRRRRRAVLVAGHAGDVVVIRSHEHDSDASVRGAVLSSLARAGALTADDLREGLGDPSPAVRRRSLELVAAAHGGGPAQDVEIVSLLDDDDPTVVETAAWAAGEREPPEPGAVERLAQLTIAADDALVREAAVASLGAIGDPRGLAAILEATTDKATVRRRAVLALAPFEGDEVDAALRRALDDRDWQVRQAAEDLLQH